MGLCSDCRATGGTWSPPSFRRLTVIAQRPPAPPRSRRCRHHGGAMHADEVAVEDACPAHRVAAHPQVVRQARTARDPARLSACPAASAPIGPPAATRPSTGRRRSGPAICTPAQGQGPAGDEGGACSTRMPRARPGTRSMAPAASRASRWYCAARTPLKPRARQSPSAMAGMPRPRCARATGRGWPVGGGRATWLVAMLLTLALRRPAPQPRPVPAGPAPQRCRHGLAAHR